MNALETIRHLIGCTDFW